MRGAVFRHASSSEERSRCEEACDEEGSKIFDSERVCGWNPR